jgi:hypothetical protein
MFKFFAMAFAFIPLCSCATQPISGETFYMDYLEYQKLQAGNDYSVPDVFYYIGYVKGISETLMVSNVICVSGDFRLGQFYDTVGLAMKNNPKVRSDRPVDIVAGALVNNYGCNKK